MGVPISINVMYVEDSASDQLLLQLLMEEAGYKTNITFAYDGEQAEEILASNCSPDVIFLDVNMPRKNGYEFLRENDVELCKKEIPVVVITSSIHEEDKNTMSSFKSVKEYLVKPLDVITLKKLSVINQFD